MKWEDEKSKATMNNDKDDSIDNLAQKPSMQKVAQRTKITFSINNISNATTLKQIENILEISSLMLSIWGSFTFFPLIVENKDLLLA